MARQDYYSSGQWAGCYVTAHNRVRAMWGRANLHSCITCGRPARDWAYDGTDPDQLTETRAYRNPQHYSIWPEYYMPLCRTCHLKRDAAQRRSPPIRSYSSVY